MATRVPYLLNLRKVMFTRVRRMSCCALAVAAIGLTCSCGSQSAPYSGPAISVTVGALPVVDDVGAYIAADQGIFQKYGLNVTIKQVLTSLAAIPQMKSGAIDILGGGNYVSFIEQAAKAHGAPPFTILSEAATCSTGSFEVLTLPGSGIQTPADLEHKTIAVNLTNNIQTLMINSVLKSDDVNISSLRYVAIPFPKMVAALEAHQVNAISVVEPFATTAEQKAGAEPLLDQCSGPDSNLPLSGYISTSAWAGQNAAAVQRFQAAMAEAQEIADTNRAVVEKTLERYITGLTPVEAATITLEEFPTSLDAVQLNRVSDLMREAGLIHGSIQASSLISR
jgi:NitT/TauT family transport system substrate-binding protein